MGDFLRKMIASGLGTGYLPVAPGTWGSAAVAGVFLAAASLSGGSAVWVAAAMGSVVILASVGCVATGRFAERAFGKKDARRCTADEWAGQALTYLLLPVGMNWTDWVIVAGVGFLCFRVMDIVKPPPARRLEKLPHGWGVLLDDLVAAVYANLAAQISLRWCYGL